VMLLQTAEQKVFEVDIKSCNGIGTQADAWPSLVEILCVALNY
jgi:hypothetical protein